MRRHPNRRISGIHIVRDGGQPGHDVVHVSNMDGDRNLSGPRGQLLAHLNPLGASACPTISIKKAVVWPPKAPNSVTAKKMRRMSGQSLSPSEYFSNLAFSARH
jgi:hypothetical protein